MRATIVARAARKSASSASTHFGFQDVPLTAKQGLVGQVFSRVASRYDLMNDAMSGFMHRVWKDAFVTDLSPTSDMRVIDCAGGTGDIAFRVIQSAPKTQVTVLDMSPEMLDVGRAKAKKSGIDDDLIRFIEGNAENLPFPDNVFDAYTISFGMRNVPRPAIAMDEAVRVLKPGGRFMMLEFALVQNSLLRQVYDLYSFNVIPAMGQAIAGDRDSYQYLVESIRKFPKQNEILQMMKDAGLVANTATDYSQGIAACYSGFKRKSLVG